MFCLEVLSSIKYKIVMSTSENINEIRTKSFEFGITTKRRNASLICGLPMSANDGEVLPLKSKT